MTPATAATSKVPKVRGCGGRERQEWGIDANVTKTQQTFDVDHHTGNQMPVVRMDAVQIFVCSFNSVPYQTCNT